MKYVKVSISISNNSSIYTILVEISQKVEIAGFWVSELKSKT